MSTYTSYSTTSYSTSRSPPYQAASPGYRPIPPNLQPLDPSRSNWPDYGYDTSMSSSSGYSAQYASPPLSSASISRLSVSSPYGGYEQQYGSSPGVYTPSGGPSGSMYSTQAYPLPDVSSMAAAESTKSRKRRGNLPKETTDKLRTWFKAHLSHPYPTEEEKQELMRQTGLQMSTWISCSGPKLFQHPQTLT
jgi:hypothetical protein